MSKKRAYLFLHYSYMKWILIFFSIFALNKYVHGGYFNQFLEKFNSPGIAFVGPAADMMGGASMSHINDLSSIYWNVADTTETKKMQIQTGIITVPIDIKDPYTNIKTYAIPSNYVRFRYLIKNIRLEVWELIINDLRYKYSYYHYFKDPDTDIYFNINELLQSTIIIGIDSKNIYLGFSINSKTLSYSYFDIVAVLYDMDKREYIYYCDIYSDDTQSTYAIDINCLIRMGKRITLSTKYELPKDISYEYTRLVHEVYEGGETTYQTITGKSYYNTPNRLGSIGIAFNMYEKDEYKLISSFEYHCLGYQYIYPISEENPYFNIPSQYKIGLLLTLPKLSAIGIEATIDENNSEITFEGLEIETGFIDNFCFQFGVGKRSSSVGIKFIF